MQKNAKIGLILGIGAAVAAVSYYFLIYKPSKANGSTAAGNSGAGSQTTNPNTGGAATTAPTTLVGKHVYAKQTPVYEVYSNGQAKRTINKDGWVGLVYEEVTLSGNPFYRVGTNTYVAKPLVYAK